MNNKVEKSKWSLWESKRKYNALTKYDIPTSFEERTEINIDMNLFTANAKAEDYNIRNIYGSIARVTSIDGMCHMTFNVVTTSKYKYFEIEFYDTVIYSYGVPKLQKIYTDISKYLKLNLESLPATVEEFVEQLLTWFEALSPLLEKHRDKQKKIAEQAKIETTLADSNVKTIIE